MIPNSKAYYAPLVTKPVIVTGPGRYQTRCGEIVTVVEASSHHDHGCLGAYPDGTGESWHKSGRIFAGRETNNDIIAAAA